MNRRGSWSQLPPALKLCASPGPPVVQLTSSRICHFVCSVVCGAFGFAPAVTPFGNCRNGRLLLPGIAFLKLAYWKISSFSIERPITQLSFAFPESNWLLLVDHMEGAARSAVPCGCELESCP